MNERHLYYMVWTYPDNQPDKGRWWTWNSGNPSHGGRFPTDKEASRQFRLIFQGWIGEVHEVVARPVSVCST